MSFYYCLMRACLRCMVFVFSWAVIEHILLSINCEAEESGTVAEEAKHGRWSTI